jgi:RNA polymerase sigma-70 factor, ECF subfamily
MSAQLPENLGTIKAADATPASGPATLGDVLYAGGSRSVPTEKEWFAFVRSVAAGDETALHALYERAHRLVFTLSVRITGSRESAEEVTLDVFHDVWRRAAAYDPANGTVLGWIMNQARSRAIDRVRFETRKKRIDPGSGEVAGGEEAADGAAILHLKQQSAAVRKALAVLTEDERRAVEAAFFSGLTHAEVAARLDQPLGTIKTRIRSSLRKLRDALGEQEGSA